MTEQQQERELSAAQRIPGLEAKVAELQAANERLEKENGKLALQLYREMDAPPVVVPESFESACERVQAELDAAGVVEIRSEASDRWSIRTSGGAWREECDSLWGAIEKMRAADAQGDAAQKTSGSTDVVDYNERSNGWEAP